MQTFLEVLFVLALVVPPAAIVLGALALAFVPARRAHAPEPVHEVAIH
jgi:hypothetical protein